jgi:ankyrin repeat protein
VQPRNSVFAALAGWKATEGIAQLSARVPTWSLSSVLNSVASSDDTQKTIEKQAELANADDTVWAACRAADWGKLEQLLDAKPRDVFARGGVGETLLHSCYLMHSAKHTEVAHRLLERAPTLVDSIYEGDAYHGENALHMAIANADMAEARFLVARSPTLIYGHADGAFFARGASAYYG